MRWSGRCKTSWQAGECSAERTVKTDGLFTSSEKQPAWLIITALHIPYQTYIACSQTELLEAQSGCKLQACALAIAPRNGTNVVSRLSIEASFEPAQNMGNMTYERQYDETNEP